MDPLIERFDRRDERALARAITLIESGSPRGDALLGAVRARGGRARIVGVTGSPGSGKSTLVDRLIGHARARGERVAVVAVDPTSPYSGGAILGDRIRMTRWHGDRDVFVRSMAARGHLGGLAATTLQVVALLDAFGFDLVLVETVGVGQSEVAIADAADTTVLVLTPGGGDGVQAFKAGIMEIADLFAINKADLPGAGRLGREIRAALDLGHAPTGWRPPIVETVASAGEGVEALADALDAHLAWLREGDGLERARRSRVRFEVGAVLADAVRRAFAAREEAVVTAVLAGEITPAEAARDLLAGLAPAGAEVE